MIERDQIIYALKRAQKANEAYAERLMKDHDYSAEFPAADAECMEAAIRILTAPIDMILHCPKCHLQHIDAPNKPEYSYPATKGGAVHLTNEPWLNPPHRSHLCHGCGFIWRPADVPTNGVAAIQTRGKNDH